jgi:hypothetical protein
MSTANMRDLFLDGWEGGKQARRSWQFLAIQQQRALLIRTELRTIYIEQNYMKQNCNMAGVDHIGSFKGEGLCDKTVIPELV